MTCLLAYIRLAVELGHTTLKQYQYAAEHVNELGKLCQRASGRICADWGMMR